MCQTRRRSETGQTTVMIIGLAVILMMLAAVVVDASAAYLQRQGLATIADGAALHGADGGVDEGGIYGQGLGERAGLDPAAVRASITAYLYDSGAYADYPGLQWTYRVVADEVQVTIRAPVELPLHVPGSPDTATIGAAGAASADTR